MSLGFLEHWSDVEDVWENLLYNELGIEEGDHPILVTEVANTPKRNREKMAEVRFNVLVLGGESWGGDGAVDTGWVGGHLCGLKGVKERKIGINIERLITF